MVALYVILVLLVIVAAIVLVAARRPPEFRITRDKRIAAPADRLFGEVNDFRRWREWSPWENLDPGMARQYGGSESGVGATYAWTGKKSGAGSMRIDAVERGQKIQIALEFTAPWKASNRVEFTFQPDGDGTRVTWTMTGHNALGLRIFGVLVNMDRLVGRDFENGLAGLERVATRS